MRRDIESYHEASIVHASHNSFILPQPFDGICIDVYSVYSVTVQRDYTFLRCRCLYSLATWKKNVSMYITTHIAHIFSCPLRDQKKIKNSMLAARWRKKKSKPYNSQCLRSKTAWESSFPLQVHEKKRKSKREKYMEKKKKTSPLSKTRVTR